MRIGIISEGKGDLAVIDNILKGVTNLDASNFIHIRPSDDYDETDLNKPDRSRSTWSLVKKECVDGDGIQDFLELEGSKYVILHIDADKSQEFEVLTPERNDDYCIEIRSTIVDKIKEWLNGRFAENILFAVAVEEIEAWLLTIYRKPRKDTSTLPNPKRTLETILAKANINTTSNYNNYQKLSKPFSKIKEIEVGKFLNYNCSLRLFYEEVKLMWLRENPYLND